MAKLVETFQRLQKIETACLPKDDPAPGECAIAYAWPGWVWTRSLLCSGERRLRAQCRLAQSSKEDVHTRARPALLHTMNASLLACPSV